MTLPRASEDELAAADKAVLITLYEATGGATWSHRDGWLDDETPVGEWYGVTANERRRVTELDLSENQLRGQIPAVIGNLTALTKLDLYHNGLHGTIPPELGKLHALTFLGLSRNSLESTIPSIIGNLTRLTFLGINDNALYGPIPPVLGELYSLTFLGLRDNNLTGPIPTELGNLTALTQLGLNRNQLTGPIPATLGELRVLQRLILSDNQLNGHIPATLGEISSLTHLAISNNHISGTSPSELGDLASLVELWANDNDISGQIPSQLAELRDLEYLNFNGNPGLQGARPIRAAGGAPVVNIFNLDIRGLIGEPRPPELALELARPSTLVRSVIADRPKATPEDENATFHLFAVVPIELYAADISEFIRFTFQDSNEWKEWNKSTFVDRPSRRRQREEPDRRSSLLADLGMTISQSYYTPRPLITDGHLLSRYAVFLGNQTISPSPSSTALCLVLHSQYEITTSHADAAMYRRIRWAMSISDGPPSWLRDQLPYNPQGALYRAVWIWIYQRYVRQQWHDIVLDHIGAIHDVIIERIDERFGGGQIVELIRNDAPHIFAFSALELGALRGQETMWREHFPTTGYALDILNAIDDDVPSSRQSMYDEAFGQGVYRELIRMHIVLANLAYTDEQEVLTSSQLFESIADEIVQKLSSFDLAEVRKGLVKHQSVNRHELQSDWIDLEDAHDHLLLMTEPDAVTLVTANSEHINELVRMEVVLQSVWNKYQHLSWNLNEILEDTSRHDIDEDQALRELSELALTAVGWRTRLSGWRRDALQLLRDASKLDENIDDFFKASEEYVRHAAVTRDKRFQRVVAVAGIALAAVVLGEITISIAGAGGAAAGGPDSVEASVSVLVAVGAGLVSLLLVASTFTDWSRQWQVWGSLGGAFFVAAMVTAFAVSTVPDFGQIKLWLFGDFWWPWPGLPLLGLTSGFVAGSVWSWFKAWRKT